MLEGDSVRIVKCPLRNVRLPSSPYRRFKSIEDHVGRTGIIRRLRHGAGLTVDVRLDFPLKDGRRHIWCYEQELERI